MTREPLPAGKLNCRHRQMRGVWQCFAGNTYLDLASGDTPEEAVQALRHCYLVEVGTPVIIHWTKDRKYTVHFSLEQPEFT